MEAPSAKWAQVCKDGQSAAFKPDENTWSDETWQQLIFNFRSVSLQVYVRVPGAGPGASFTIRAPAIWIATAFSTFERMGALNTDGEVGEPQASSLTRIGIVGAPS